MKFLNMLAAKAQGAEAFSLLGSILAIAIILIGFLTSAGSSNFSPFILIDIVVVALLAGPASAIAFSFVSDKLSYSFIRPCPQVGVAFCGTYFVVVNSSNVIVTYWAVTAALAALFSYVISERHTLAESALGAVIGFLTPLILEMQFAS